MSTYKGVANLQNSPVFAHPVDMNISSVKVQQRAISLWEMSFLVW